MYRPAQTRARRVTIQWNHFSHPSSQREAPTSQLTTATRGVPSQLGGEGPAVEADCLPGQP